MPNIFLDLDDTLVHSYWVRDTEQRTKHLERIKDRYESVDILLGLDEHYCTAIRPIAFQLINYCESLVGHDNVYMLTLGINEYAHQVNKEAGLGFKLSNIYSREDLPYNVPKFKNQSNILIDNEDYFYHIQGQYNKVKFLHGLPSENYIQINEFNSMYDFPLDWPIVDETDYFEDLKKQILNTLIYTNL